MNGFIEQVAGNVLANLISTPITALLAAVFGIVWARARRPRVSRDAETTSASPTVVRRPARARRRPIRADLSIATRQRRADWLERTARERLASRTPSHQGNATPIPIPAAIALGFLVLAYGLYTLPGLVALSSGWTVGVLVGVFLTWRMAPEPLSLWQESWRPAVAALVGAVFAAALAFAAWNSTFNGISVAQLWVAAAAYELPKAPELETPAEYALRHALHPLNAFMSAVKDQDSFSAVGIALFVLALVLAMLFWVSLGAFQWRARIEFELGSDKPRIVERAVVFEMGKLKPLGTFGPWFPTWLGGIGILLLLAPSIVSWATTSR